MSFRSFRLLNGLETERLQSTVYSQKIVKKIPGDAKHEQQMAQWSQNMNNRWRNGRKT